MTRNEIARLKTSLKRVFERLGEAKKTANEGQIQDIDVARQSLINAFDALVSLWHKS